MRVHPRGRCDGSYSLAHLRHVGWCCAAQLDIDKRRDRQTGIAPFRAEPGIEQRAKLFLADRFDLLNDAKTSKF